MNESINNIYLLILPFVILGIYAGFSILPICIFLILIRLISTNRQTSGFFLILYGGILGGIIRTAYPFFPIYGTLLEGLGICLLYKDFYKIFKKQRAGFASLMTLLVFFAFTYLYGPHTEYANSKLFGIIEKGLVSFLAFYVFERAKAIEIEGLVQMLIITAVSLIIFSMNYYHFRVGGFFDYEWYRANSEAWQQENEERMLGGYQLVGMYAAFAGALFLSMKKIDLKKSIYYILLSFQVIMTSGCRQALLAIVAVIFIRIMFFNNSGKSSKNLSSMIIGSFFIFLAYVFIKNSDISTLTRTVDEGDAGRFMIYISAINIFISNPVLGVGLGGFPENANIPIETPWPHNLFLEILCETGLIGLIVITTILVLFVRKSKINFRYVTASGCYLFLFLIALFVRVMVSGDFTVSIELFSALFAYGYSKKRTYIEDDKLFNHNTFPR